MSTNNLSKEGILSLVKQMKGLQPRQLLVQEYVFQIVDNYFPSKEFTGWLGFRISDGYTKIKCFISQKNQFISTLQRNREDLLQKYPIIKTKELIDITSSQKGDLEPFVMIKNYEVIYEDIDQIIGCPLPYKIYEERGFQNPQGKTNIPGDDQFDFDELEKNLQSFGNPVPKIQETIVFQSKNTKNQNSSIQLVKKPAIIQQQQQEQYNQPVNNSNNLQNDRQKSHNEPQNQFNQPVNNSNNLQNDRQKSHNEPQNQFNQPVNKSSNLQNDRYKSHNEPQNQYNQTVNNSNNLQNDRQKNHNEPQNQFNQPKNNSNNQQNDSQKNHNEPQNQFNQPKNNSNNQQNNISTMQSDPYTTQNQYKQNIQPRSFSNNQQNTTQANYIDPQSQFKPNNQQKNFSNTLSKSSTTISHGQQNSSIQQQRAPQQTFQVTHQKQLDSRNKQPQECYPICMLNNMTQHPFKGRVVRLDDVRQFGGQNGKKNGKIFSIQILDENDLIIGTFFDAAVDKWHNRLTLGRVYIFSGAQIKLSRQPEVNKQMGCITFEALFDANSKIEETDDDPDIKQNKFNFTFLGSISQKKKDDIVDTIGIVKSAGQTCEFVPKFKTEPQLRRSLIIYDQSLTEIEIGLFGNLCNKFDFAINEIYQFKCFKVSEYNSKRGLQSSYNSTINDDLSIKEAKILADWRSNAGDDLQLLKISDVETVKGIKTIDQVIQDTKVCETDKQQKVYSNIRAHLMHVKGSGTLYYLSCTQCLKKAIQDQSGGYSCQTCKIQMDEPRCRYILTVKLVDSTGNLWVTVGDQVAAQLITTSADIIKQFNDQGKEKEKNEALSENVYREYKFKISSKLEEYNDVARVKHQIVSASQENLIEDTNQYLKLIQFYVDNV